MDQAKLSTHIFLKTMTKKVKAVRAYIVKTPDDGSF
jgi:hypothetical protein